MNPSELLQAIVKKIKRYKIIILAAGILFALLAFMYANGKRTTYTSKATLFPLLSPSDNTISNSMLQGILGLNDAPKSFSSEATINIIELAQKTGAIEFHTSARVWTNSNMEHINRTMNENLQTVSVDEDEVRKLVEKLSVICDR